MPLSLFLHRCGCFAASPYTLSSSTASRISLMPSCRCWSFGNVAALAISAPMLCATPCCCHCFKALNASQLQHCYRCTLHRVWSCGDKLLSALRWLFFFAFLSFRPCLLGCRLLLVLLWGSLCPLSLLSYLTLKDFVACHDGKPRFRRPILVIIGETQLGKSMLAANVLRRIALKIGLSDFLEVTVEDSEHMDLADYDQRIHAGVLFDGIGDALFLKRNREAMQGRPKLVKGARSATNVYAYAYSFCGRAVVATLDLSASNLDQFEQDHWLSNKANVLLLRLTEPAYVEEGQASSPRRVATRKRRCWRPSPRRELDFESARWSRGLFGAAPL